VSRTSKTSNPFELQCDKLQPRNSARSRLQRGASLPFALFLFMICSLLAAVVLSASTAAVGSYKGITEMDQRYYSVTSAADLLKSKIGNSALSMQLVRQKDGSGNEKTIDVKIDGKTASVVSFNESNQTLKIQESELTLSELTAVYWLLGGTQPSTGYDQVNEIPAAPITTSVENKYKLDFKGDPADSDMVASKLNTAITSIVDSNGLTLQIDSPHDSDSDSEKNFYSLALHFDADIDESQSERTVRNADGTDTTTTTTTVTLTWMASDISKAGV